MKKHLFFLFGLVISLSACTDKPISLIGIWVPDKVNVAFDETLSTPEMVKQIGEIERQNSIAISADSILTFESLDGKVQGRLSLSNDGFLFVDGTPFGQWKEGQIVTQTDSRLGKIRVSYRKK